MLTFRTYSIKLFILCLQFEPEDQEEEAESNQLEEGLQQEEEEDLQQEEEDNVPGDQAAAPAMPPPPCRRRHAAAAHRSQAQRATPYPVLPLLGRGGGAPRQGAPLHREAPVEVSTKVIFT